MDHQQQHTVQRDLCIDGYIAQMFGPQAAQKYHVSLRREPGQTQLQADVAGTDAFLATPLPGPTSGQHGWVTDYAVKDRGPVIRQKIWTPKKESDKRRWVDHDQLHPPIFFIHKDGKDLGLPLMDAAGGDCRCLRGAEETAPVGTSAHAEIRINVSSIFCVHSPELMMNVYPSQWCGYLDWSRQILIQRQTQPKETISLETFAKNVAKKTKDFMEVFLILLPTFLQETDARTYQNAKNKEMIAENKDNDCDQPERYPIGDEHISPGDVILIGTVQVSHGSWMPILQLNNGYAQCLGM
jgi:hypothetical protein